MEPSPVDPILVDVPTAAKMISVSKSFLWRLIAEGQVPAVRVGKTLRVNPQRMLEALDSNEATSR